MNLLANPDTLELPDVAVNEGRTRVVASLIAADAVELDDLFVDPEWMRQRAGQAQVLDIIAIARKHGVQCVEVTANPACASLL